MSQLWHCFRMFFESPICFHHTWVFHCKPKAQMVPPSDSLDVSLSSFISPSPPSLSLPQVWAGVWPGVRAQIRSISSVISWSPWHWWKRSEHWSKNYKLATPDQPTITTRTRRRSGLGGGEWGQVSKSYSAERMKGEKMEIWRLTESLRAGTWKKQGSEGGSGQGG